MAGRTPPFKADLVGSLLRPPAIHEARARHEKGELPDEALRAIEDRCVEQAVAMQKSVGLKVCTDGDFRRRNWQRDFLKRIGGVEERGGLPMTFHNEQGSTEFAPPRFEVHGKLRREQDLAVQYFRALKPVAERHGLTPKQTIPSPMCLHFRGGRAAINEKVYPDMQDFFEDLAQVYREEIAALHAAGCRYLQIDDTNLAYLCDPKLRDHVLKIGEDPAALPKLYARMINDAIRDKPADMTICLHMCRGNRTSYWVAEGGYDPIAIVFDEMNVDGFFLEYDTPRAGSFEPLRHLNGKKVAVLGLVTTKKPDLESKDTLKRRIDEASKYVALERLAFSPQCGFASTLDGNALNEDEQRRKLQLVAETAEEVWGSA